MCWDGMLLDEVELCSKEDWGPGVERCRGMVKCAECGQRDLRARRTRCAEAEQIERCQVFPILGPEIAQIYLP